MRAHVCRIVSMIYRFAQKGGNDFHCRSFCVYCLWFLMLDGLPVLSFLELFVDKVDPAYKTAREFQCRPMR